MKKIAIFLISLFIISATNINVSAQININNVKKNVKIKKKDKKNSKNKKSQGNDYSSYVALGDEKVAEEDYLSAVKYYNAALELKPGDYTATQKAKQAEKSLRDQYFDKIEDEVKNNDCDQAQSDLDTVMVVLGSWGQQNYLQKEIDKCKENSNSTSTNVAKVDISKIPAGSGKFYTDFATKEFKDKANIGDELFVVFNLGKTMIEHTVDLGMEESFYAYGFFTFTIDGKKVAVIGPYSFASNISKVWTDFTVPLSVNTDFAERLKANPGLLTTEQDFWLLQQLYGDNSIPMQYVILAIGNMQSAGNHSLKVEFGLGKKDDKEPVGNVCSAEITIVTDKDGLKKLYAKGPKYMRPLADEDMGKFTFASNTLNIGTTTLTTTLELPKPPKYYNMYWCQSSSCDYDHGELNFYAELDGKFLASWSTTFWKDEYTGKKTFKLTIMPTSDKELTNDLASYNSEDLFKKTSSTNPLPYALFDKIYNGEMSVGTHTLKIKVYSPESVPMNTAYENNAAWQNRWPAIAENTVKINLTADAKQKLISSSSAKKLSHAGGKWTTVDNILKKSTPNDGATILDVATYTDWEVTVDAWKIPVYRTCYANVLYKTKNNAYRIMRGVAVKEDYKGNSSYGKPYFSERPFFGYSSGMLNPMNYPVPASKVK